MEPLTEKYRPKALDEVVGQPENIETIKKLLEKRESQQIPSLLLYGGAGLGKSATAEAIANEINAELSKFNASSEGKKETAKEKIVPALRNAWRPKVVVIEEADGLSGHAQMSLKEDISQNQSTKAILILITNHIDKIVDPIKSRCMPFEYEPIETKQIKQHLEHIAKKEDLDSDLNGEIQKIAKRADGDIRKAINQLDRETLIDDDKTKETAKQIFGE
ncbi:MAG: ATPase involved in DNA replication HolB small subunit [Candidatus Methanohalarchaeum thermophilum]|uniref:ATPase involved in DNA replication HolB small subunit n=1 Tax=Methanohalarchaeum thermophilum TaxID=1903181 RepID=A0A1Q6DWR7_METT1|nr:MAG: ATPase involved in DNA replication HolB small subunit [Candidatus Methanohalarchaeum thermophilum]